MTARHAGYWLTPLWIKGFTCDRLFRLHVGLSRSLVTHRGWSSDYQWLNECARYGFSFGLFRWTWATYIDRHGKFYRLPEPETEIALAVDGGTVGDAHEVTTPANPKAQAKAEG